jgi:nitroimidazol reductase NimA-like FMN-containing flavoprotein (pyridoxamine 5'-phosphate oxidase superfamily)
MRRTDLEITDKNEIIKIIDKSDVCRIALSQNNIPYIIPMNFGYEYENDKLVLYFHCAKEGKKIDIIKSNSAACFEIDWSGGIIVVKTAYNYSWEYESVVGTGNIILVSNDETDEKRKALGLIMKKYELDETFDFSEAYYTSEMLDSVAILKFTVDDFTGKRRIK